MKKKLDEKLQNAFPWLKQPELHKEKPYEFVEGYNHYENYVSMKSVMAGTS